MSFGQEKAARFDDKHFEVLFFNTCSFFLAVVLHVLAASLPKASKCSFFLAKVLHVLAASLSKASKKFFH